MKKLILCCLFMLSSLALSADLPQKNCSELKEIKCQIASHHRSRPHVRLGQKRNESISGNWSGYAALTSITNPASNSVTEVVGYWTVPKLTATSSDAYSSIWVGIDGFSSTTVEQIGTEHDWSSGKQQNYAWFEMYPKGSYLIGGFPVNPGDSIGAEVSYQGSDTFKLSIYNYTKKVYTVVPSSYTKAKGTKRSSAEWIVEAPSEGTSILPLADFNKVSFSNCQATINGKTGSINDPHWKDDEIFMATTNKEDKADPSSLSNNGKNFAVTWKHE